MFEIVWFKNNHEQRLYWLKFGLMQLHKLKQIKFIEKDNSELHKEDIHHKIVGHEHRHTAIIKVRINDVYKFALIDAEDSFFQLCPLIQYVDLYYCSAYNTDFFSYKKFDVKLLWQNEDDVLVYRTLATKIINDFGVYFHKVRKLFPIGPNLDPPVKTRLYITNKLINLQNKIYKLFNKGNNWQEGYILFEKRYNKLLSYRNLKVKYDIVLLDSLWGWPEHRIKLHKNLIILSKKYNILSELRYNENIQSSNIDPTIFPLISNPIGENYEYKLASSKLAIFATGFHFGWRNIVPFSLMIGLPVYMDEVILEPYFDLGEFKIYTNKDEFNDIESILNSLDSSNLEIIKKHNQTQFEKYLSPIACAKHLVNSISE